MFQIKYGKIYTFFLSLGILAIVFGVVPFYNMKSWIKLIIHIACVLIGGYLFYKGIRKWNDEEKSNKELTSMLKEQMKGELELNRINRKKEQLNLQTIEGNQELEITKKKLTKIKKDHEGMKEKIRKKIDEIIKQQEELQDERKRLLEKEQEIYEKQSKNIDKLPNTFASGTAVTFGSGLTTMPFYSGNKSICLFCYQSYDEEPGIISGNMCPECRRKVSNKEYVKF